MQPKQVKLAWVDEPDLELTSVDELHLQVANDRVYLTFGQVRLPVNQEPVSAEIRVVARLVATSAFLEKIGELLDNVRAEMRGKK